MSIVDKFTLDVITPYGRPTLIISIDIHSRMVVGHSIAFDSPSLQNALRAIESVNQPPAAPSDDVASPE